MTRVITHPGNTRDIPHAHSSQTTLESAGHANAPSHCSFFAFKNDNARGRSGHVSFSEKIVILFYLMIVAIPRVLRPEALHCLSLL